MTNKKIATAFDELAKLMELHEQDKFRVSTYSRAYMNLRKLEKPLSDMEKTEILALKGIGKATAAKIDELIKKGKMETLEKWRNQTPPGILEMLKVKGFGPKKIKVIWKEMEVDTIGELLYACNENRLVELKGFGEKTQTELKKKLEFYLRSKDKFRMDTAEEEADFAAALVAARLRPADVRIVGEVRRRCPVVHNIELLVAGALDPRTAFDDEAFVLEHTEGNSMRGRLASGTAVVLHFCEKAAFGSKMLRYTGPESFIKGFAAAFSDMDFKNIANEEAVFEKAGIPFIEPELRDFVDTIDQAQSDSLPELLTEKDIIGVLHNHTTYSDGIHSLRTMCEAARDLGYGYIGITDHSQSAFYANGLKADRVAEQMAEIDALNVELAPFKIFKGIESDILNDGSLDYPDAILEQFDFVIASVHSNLRMGEAKATERIVKAIQNPYTTILGHPTSRLLLARVGYPLDWEQIFAACAAQGVAIELNANPHRLDLDYTLIPSALRRGIKIAINPDAHSVDGFRHIRYGTLVARKGGLTAAACVNTMDAAAFEAWIKKS